ncbi:MAG TPA: MATE family efflux transporter [Vicinamibacterales bacterium]|nr:MATE family efflux transporter [Vicinamibacterales bacterium]
MSNAAATLVGQNLGAKQPDRAEASVWRAAFYNMLFLTGIGVVFVVWADVIVSAFTTDPVVGPIAVRGLRIISAGFPFYAYAYVVSQSFNGAGDTLTPTLINVLCLWMGEIPMAYVLSRTAGLGPSGAFWAVAVAFSVMSVVSAVLFRRGRWKTKRV